MDNKNENFNESVENIEEILSDFKEKKERKEQQPIEPLEPPKRRENLIDFSKNDDSPSQDKNINKRKIFQKSEKTPEELEKIKAQKKEKQNRQKEAIKIVITKIKKILLNKKVLLSIAAIAAAVAIAFGIQYAVKASKSAYLKPYEDKYPQAHFEVGMQKKYLDMLGENPSTVGYIEIPELNLQTPVSSDSSKFPYAQPCTEGAEQVNFAVYLNDNQLEAHYATAQAYNQSSGYITYSDLFKDYNFKVVGVFYTSTLPEDDNGYIFPYNVTEKMTVKSASEFASRLQNRFIYSTGVNITRQDTLLILSCPTDYRKNFRFVLVGALREDTSAKATATEKSDIRYPQIICDELKIDNTYKYAAPWYPEIIIKNDDGSEGTLKKTIDDYKLN